MRRPRKPGGSTTRSSGSSAGTSGTPAGSLSCCCLVSTARGWQLQTLPPGLGAAHLPTLGSRVAALSGPRPREPRAGHYPYQARPRPLPAPVPARAACTGACTGVGVGLPCPSPRIVPLGIPEDHAFGVRLYLLCTS